MAWTQDQLSQTGLGFAQQIGGFIAASRAAKEARAWQKYNNKMVRLQNGMNQNVLTTNENIQREATLEKRFGIRKSEYATIANATVQAAASGTVGRSVNHVMNQIHRNAAEADGRAAQEFEYAKMQIDEQRRQSSMQTQMSLDLRQIQGPSPIALALGLGASAQPLFQG
jgi:hypothetical protein